tara:strand:+ start:297 stop:488 length:192 start_codon:yes stop_codon:yes gene_type:complete
MSAEEERAAIVAWLEGHGQKYQSKSKKEGELLVPRLHDQWCGANLIVFAARIANGDHLQEKEQ